MSLSRLQDLNVDCNARVSIHFTPLVGTEYEQYDAPTNTQLTVSAIMVWMEKDSVSAKRFSSTVCEAEKRFYAEE